MPRYEYKVVPAPAKGVKAKGVKSAEARFAHAIEELMNELGAEGWEYQRSDTLPSIERSGLASTTTEWRHLLVFRRPRETDVEAFSPELLPPPAPVSPEAETVPVAAATSTPEVSDTGDAAKADDSVKDDGGKDGSPEKSSDDTAVTDIPKPSESVRAPDDDQDDKEKDNK